MNLSKFNFREINYFCKGRRIDFDCLPFRTQLEVMVEIIDYYKINEISGEDIVEFYKILSLKSPRTGKVIKPSLTKILEGLSKINGIDEISNNRFYINELERKLYKNELKYGYDNGDIK